MGKKLTLLEYDRKVAEILARMRAEAIPFEEDSEEAKLRRKERARKNRLWFAKMYLPHYITRPFGKFHRDLDKLLDIRGEMVFFAGPRESGKTTLDALVAPLHDILFERRHFIILISETDKQASDYASFIKIELEQNERIRQDFGDLIGRHQWEDGDFVTKNNVRVLSRGRGQAIKGLRWRQYRPDRIVVIDMENMKTSRNPRIVKENISYIAGEVRGGMAKDGSFFMEGQIIRKKCVLAHFINEKDDQGNPKYISRVVRAIVNGKSYWPEGAPIEELERIKEDMGVVEFNRWYQNNPEDEEGLFREEWIKYYHPDELANRELWTYMAIDPSMGSGESSDNKAIITISRDKDGIIYVRDAFIRKTTPDGMVRAAYNRYETWHPIQIGCEENSIKEFLDTPFNNFAREKGYHLPLVKIKNTIAKEARIARLSPLIENGKIRFFRGQGDQDELIEELIFYGQPGVYDDGPDALEMAVRLSQKVADLVVAID